MVSRIITEGGRMGAFLLSEAAGERSREHIMIPKSNTSYVAGQILSKNAAGMYVAFQAPAAGATADVAILWEDRPADPDADRRGAAIVRDAEVAADLLVGLTDASRAALIAQKIILRPAK
jgi:hypothetical protein